MITNKRHQQPKKSIFTDIFEKIYSPLECNIKYVSLCGGNCKETAFIHMIEDSEHDFHYINKCINYISKLMLKNNSAQDFGLLKILQNMK